MVTSVTSVSPVPAPVVTNVPPAEVAGPVPVQPVVQDAKPTAESSLRERQQQQQQADSEQRPSVAGFHTLRFMESEEGRVMIEVRNEQGELVRTIPPESLAQVLRNEYNRSGLFIDVLG